jgi:2-oxoisovalerate dehydrogenase E1 component
LFAPEVGLLGTSGIVGPAIGLATGAGYAFMLRRQPHVGVAFFGDGASNNGIFHEALNMAAVWKLPVLYVCENNQYATEIAFASVAAKVDIAGRGAALGVTSVSLDGNDVMAIYEAAGAAVQRARAGDGPSLLVCTTYRTRPHSEGMRDTGYRTQAEIDSWKLRDPITLFRDRLLAAQVSTAADLDQIDRDALALAEDAIAFASDSPWPDPATATDHVFSEAR